MVPGATYNRKPRCFHSVWELNSPALRNELYDEGLLLGQLCQSQQFLL